jgi:lipoprotein-anchoring transpeptidase ErfK/SrfK
MSLIYKGSSGLAKVGVASSSLVSRSKFKQLRSPVTSHATQCRAHRLIRGWLINQLPSFQPLSNNTCRTRLTGRRGPRTTYRKHSQAYHVSVVWAPMWSQYKKMIVKRIGPFMKRIGPLVERGLLIKISVTMLVFAGAGLAIWSSWPTAPPPVPSPKAPSPKAPSLKADLVVVQKAARRLDLYQNGMLLKSYAVSLGPNPVGPKLHQGDGRTPEGEYRIDYRKADSSFHRALHISYPEPKDTAAARTRGVSPGGLIMIHGTKNGLTPHREEQLPADWTEGCIAVTNQEIDEIWRNVPDGTKIILEP